MKTKECFNYKMERGQKKINFLPIRLLLWILPVAGAVALLMSDLFIMVVWICGMLLALGFMFKQLGDRE